MDRKELLKQVINLKPADRFVIIEGILESLDKPDLTIDEIWIEESEKRLGAYRNGELEGIPYENIFSDIK
ncbi:MAG: addiction module protein [Spirochaetales bacterium]|nr:addiction module protein [Spirochaetales bacterium]